MRTKYFLVLIFLLVGIQSNFAQLSTKHYIPPVVADDNNASPISDQYIYISTPRSSSVSFTITPVGDPTNVFSGVVSNTTPFIYRVVETGQDPSDPGAILDRDGDTQFAIAAITPGTNPFLNTVLNDRGYIIEANDVIYVSARFRAPLPQQVHAGALVSKGLSGLGTEFRVGGFAQENDNIVGGYLTYLSVMATENDTNVTFGDFPPGISIINHTGSTDINALLNEGETYVLAVAVDSGGNPNDLIGSLITSDKPIVVNSGSGAGSSADSFSAGGRDYGVDQIVEFSKVGSEYIFVRGNGGGDGISNGDDGDRWENVLLIAHQDNTEVFVNGSATPGATLNAGEWIVIEGDGINRNGNGYSASGNMYVQTTNPVFAYQSIGGQPGAAPNQGMFFVPPLSCENKGNVNNIANINSIGNDNGFDGGISIVTNRNSTVTVFENDIQRTILGSEGPFDVSGNPDYVTYKLGTLQNNVRVESTGELYCAYFNANGFAASGSFYSGFPTPPEINFDTNVASLGNCIPNVTLQSLNADLFDSLEWFYDDGSGGGFVSTGNTTNILIPSLAGNYRLIGTLVCSGATFESVIIPVSLCPDDLDGDLIIDNVDIDLDNDGIINCDESRGDVILDFANTNQPIINFTDSTTDNTFISSTTTVPVGTANITGDSNSNFTTVVDPGINGEIIYNLAFNEATNIEFTENSTTNHTIVDGEVFRLIIGPNTKNITLLDPDNILLVDTDFDGFFETGVDNFSASEVRFQYNPTPNGTTPFRLVANSVTEVSFIHSLANTAESSTFNGNLQLTCFALDIDGDGIPNSNDADSDNDGITDLQEASGFVPTLIGDADLDGLDDVFGTGLTPVDFDTDGVFDYLDLDSDNDGVYDFFEAGHGLTDADLDGRVDNAMNNVGMNGILDALETTPDSFILNFSILNPTTDPDNTFNYLDLESDGDNCPDVIEAGFTDPDFDNIIGTSPVTVDTEGRVIGISDGYTIPNSDYFTFAPIIINTPFEDVSFCEESTGIITIDSSATIFQWEESTDGGVNWTTLTDNTIYSGTTTTSLQISGLLLSYNNNQYRVVLERDGNSCNETSNAITLTVEPLPIISTVVELRQCDDDTDGFSIFNLNEAASDISTNFMNETFTFYPTLNDSENNTNVITNATTFTNRTVTTDIVWARATSNFGCFRISEVTLTVSTTGIPPSFQRSFTLCDDYLDINGNDNVNNDEADGVSTFNFSSVTGEVRALFPSTQQLTITYYRNQADALAEIDPIVDPSNYRNIGYPNTQNIFIRVDSNLDNDCLGFGSHITLNVNPVPTATGVSDLELCDNSDDGNFTNGIVQTFDMESQTPLILGTQDPTNFTVTYHLTAADALSGNNAITNTTMYENSTPNQETIFVRVVNNTSGCFTNHTFFDLIVNPLPIANFVEDLETCDDDLDGSAQNGFSQNIDLELQTPGILGSQDPTIYSVTYHLSLADAQAANAPLSSPFTNTDAFTQIIYVRVFNSQTQCANDISNFNVIVNPEPTNENIGDILLCDDVLDGDDTNGFIQNIDLNSVIPDILGPLQDEDDFTVTFHETQTDATNGIGALTSPYTNSTRSLQPIFVRIVNDDTGCINDSFMFNVIINPLPDFTVTTPQIVCLNGPPLTISVENPADMYDYVWTDPQGNDIIGVSEITITTGGIYTVVGTTTDGTNCSRTREIEVNESIIATITEDAVTIVDDSDNNSISIDPTNLGIGDYEFALLDEENDFAFNFQDSPVFENLTGGFYTILIRDKNGCGVVSLLVSVVEFPKFFTPNGDGENDTWAIKGANSTFFPTSEVSIFNRFGKLVATINIDNPGWNGFYNGKVLPSDDYWFSIKLTDRNDVVRERKGNFALLRR